jgi:hypothetical protein
MTVKFASYAAAAFLAGGFLAASALVPAQAASSPKLTTGHYYFNANLFLVTTGGDPGVCLLQQGANYQFEMVYNPSGKSTIRFAMANGSGAELIVLTVGKKTGSGPWNADYTGNAYDENGLISGDSWSGTFSATGTTADKESIAMSMTLTGVPDPTPSPTTCTATFYAAGFMSGTGN